MWGWSCGFELDRFFEQVDGDPGRCALVACGRVVSDQQIVRAREWAIEQRWFPDSTDDLLGINEDKINDTRLYRCLDRIPPHKTKLERHLKDRYGELFELSSMCCSTT